jgi:hypothetical protein
VWRRAQRVAASYQLILSPEPGVGYLGRTVEMPLAMADGPTIAACAARTLESTTVAVATLLESGGTPPVPAGESRRDQQVNIRLTRDERLRLEASARRAGYRSLSDFMRAAALAG